MRSGTTLVIYMGLKNLAKIVAGLLGAGMRADTPACVIENGHAEDAAPERDHPRQLSAAGFEGPALVVVGEVVRFARVQKRQAGEGGMKQRVVVIGNGMVGQRFLEQLARTRAGELEVTVFCEEPRPAYDRVQLTSFFSGKTADDLSVVPDEILPGARR